MRFLIIFFFLPLRLFSQCSFCTIEITGIDSSDYVIEQGEKLCIKDGAILRGNIIVNNGLLCNAGRIVNHSIIVSGSSAEVENKGYIKSDSIRFINSAELWNRETIECKSLINDYAHHMYNRKVIIADYFINKDHVRFTNDGDIFIAYDFTNTDTSEFINYGYMSVGNDFRNSSRSQFTTQCIIDIGGSWYNINSFIASYQNCAGFNVNGFTINSGWINSINTDIDICDNGNPGQIDADHYPGSIAPYITYCQCENTCHQILSVDNAPRLSSLSIYPNPATSTLTIEWAGGSGQYTATTHNAQGQLVFHSTFNIESSTFDISSFSNGIYFLTLTNEEQTVSRKFVKE